MKLFKLFVCLLLVIAPAVADAPRLVIWTGAGMVFVPLPAGWSIGFDGAGTPTLSAPKVYDEWQQLKAVQAVFPLKCAPAAEGFRVFRNGNKNREGFDFDLKGATLTYRTPLEADDTVEFEYTCGDRLP